MTLKLGLNIVLAAAILASVVGAIMLMVRGSGTPSGMLVELPDRDPTPVADAMPGRVTVYVSGEVKSPGVYELWPDARANDALQAAGGPTADADLDRVNLAEKVADESQVHIPKRGAEPALGVAPAVPGSGPGGPTKVDLNAADLAQLDTLPDIGPVRARAIIDYREANGPFASVDDLMNVTGIGEGLLGPIRDLAEVR